MAEEEKAVEEKLSLPDKIMAIKASLAKVREENVMLKGKLEEYAKQIEEAEKQADEW